MFEICSKMRKKVKNGECPRKKFYNAIGPINLISKKLCQLQHRPDNFIKGLTIAFYYQ